MLTLIAALYVILPALLALAAVAYAYCCPILLTDEPSLEEEAEWLERIIAGRDQAAAVAIDHLNMWRHTGIESWRQGAMRCYHEALRLHNMMHDVCHRQRC